MSLTDRFVSKEKHHEHMCARIRARAGACVLASVYGFAVRSDIEVNKRRILLSPEFYIKLT